MEHLSARIVRGTSVQIDALLEEVDVARDLSGSQLDTPQGGPLAEAIEKVNEMFRAKGVEVSPESVSGFITTFWGILDTNDEVVAMAKNNTVAQLKASEGFSGAVGLAVLKTVNEPKEIQAYMTDPAFHGEISNIAADALHAQHRPDSGSGAENGEAWAGRRRMASATSSAKPGRSGDGRRPSLAKSQMAPARRSRG